MDINLEALEEAVASREDDSNNLKAVSRDVNYAGHTFGLRTLLPWEEAAAALAIQRWRSTLKEPDMWMAAALGLALTHIDGDSEFCPRSSPNDETYARQRMQYMAKEWSFPFHGRLFSEYTDMQQELLQRVERVENLSQGAMNAFMPLGDFSTDKDTSPDETLGEAYS